MSAKRPTAPVRWGELAPILLALDRLTERETIAVVAQLRAVEARVTKLESADRPKRAAR